MFNDTHLSDADRKAVHDFALAARELLEAETRDLLEGAYGLKTDGKLAPLGHLPNLTHDPEGLETYQRLGRFLEDEVKAGLERREAVEKLVKEVAFTHLNRLVAFKMMEARKLIRQTVSRGKDSNGFKFYLVDYPDEHALWQSGDAGAEVAYRHFLLWQSAQVAREIKVLFDPTNLPSHLFPRPIALGKLLELLNAEALAPAWASAETIGWIYQYFNEREKGEVFERLYKKKQKIRRQDIPAATQLFTPRWIVRFLVENTLGRTWLQVHPDSRLASELRYLVPLNLSPGPSPARRGESDSEQGVRSVRDITLLDPACGTMHFGLVAFDLFAEMYREELERAGECGWPEQPSVKSERDIPAAILAHNLFGIDIDLRAVQLSALTLYLKAKELEKDAALTTSNLACADVLALNGERLNAFLREMKFERPAYERLIRALWARLKDINQLGSLLRLEAEIEALVQEERERYDREGRQPDLFGERARFESEAAQAEYWDIVQAQLVQAFDEFARRAAQHGLDETFFAGEATKGLRVLDVMLRRYDCVTANPPYMGKGSLTNEMSAFLEANYDFGKLDLYAAFIQRCCEFLSDDGRLGMITQQSFMFISSFRNLREHLDKHYHLELALHLGPHAFEEISGEKVNTVTFCIRKPRTADLVIDYVSLFVRLVDSLTKQEAFESTIELAKDGLSADHIYSITKSQLRRMPGMVWAYNLPEELRYLFESEQHLTEIATPVCGIFTCDNNRFLRYWWEIGSKRIGRTPNSQWVVHPKGGSYRKWYGNQEYVLFWGGGGDQIRERRKVAGQSYSLPGEEFYFKEGVTWTHTTGRGLGVRILPAGVIPNIKSMVAYPKVSKVQASVLMGYLNSTVLRYLTQIQNPTGNYGIREVSALPWIPIAAKTSQAVGLFAGQCAAASKVQQSFLENTLDFVAPPSLESGASRQQEIQQRIQRLEQNLDDAVNDLLGLPVEQQATILASFIQDQTQEASDREEPTEDEEDTEISADVAVCAVRWISYAVGIVMGRFQPGVAGALGSAVYRREDFAIGSLPAPDEAEFNLLVGSPERFADVDAQGGRHIFSAQVKEQLRALVDDDGIVVLDEGHPDDLPTKVETALELMLGETGVEQVVTAVGGQPSAVNASLRRFLEREFFIKWHVRWYRKRPIYWLLQSPKKLYGVYLFHERMTQDSLYLVQRKYLDRKITLTRQLMAEKRTAAGAESGARERRALNKQADEAEKLLADLDEFARRLKAVTDGGYSPDINDGVILNMAPLRQVVPAWSKEPSKYWEGLERGEYDWAHIAMRYWPERVREKCKTDKSLAIAHGVLSGHDTNFHDQTCEVSQTSQV